MILLDSSAVSLMTVTLPPAYAKLIHRSTTFAAGASATYAIEATYAFGNVPAASAGFVEDVRVPRVSFALNEASNSIDRGGAAVQNKKRAVLQHLLGPGVVPSPGDPTLPHPVASKAEGDCKIADIDLIACTLIAALIGTNV